MPPSHPPLELLHVVDGGYGGPLVPVTVVLILPYTALHHLKQTDKMFEIGKG